MRACERKKEGDREWGGVGMNKRGKIKYIPISDRHSGSPTKATEQMSAACVTEERKKYTSWSQTPVAYSWSAWSPFVFKAFFCSFDVVDVRQNDRILIDLLLQSDIGGDINQLEQFENSYKILLDITIGCTIYYPHSS